MGRVLWASAFLVLLACSPGEAAESYRDRIDRFKLGNACQPVGLLLGGPATSAMPSDMVVAAIRSRLRAAHLYQEVEENTDGTLDTGGGHLIMKAYGLGSSLLCRS